jgi:hydroxymethylbilane synthase
VTDIEQTVRDGGADVAVHSAKDVPIEMPDDLELAGTMAREDPTTRSSAPSRWTRCRPAPASARARSAAAPSSPRCDRTWSWWRCAATSTRLRKLADGEADALVLAAAGLRRLDRADEIGALLHELVPRPGRGAGAPDAGGRVDAWRNQRRCGAASAADRGACARTLGGSATRRAGAHVEADGVLRRGSGYRTARSG